MALAEGPASYALLLGSGVSADADVPTGGDVFWTGVADLYRLTTKRSEVPDRDALRAWLKDAGGEEWTYSDILERLAEDPPARRDYLAKFFEGPCFPFPEAAPVPRGPGRGLCLPSWTQPEDQGRSHAAKHPEAGHPRRSGPGSSTRQPSTSSATTTSTVSDLTADLPRRKKRLAPRFD